MWGTRILTHEAPFTDARDPATLDTPMKKALIVMTDGSNTIGPVGVYHSTSASGIANSNTLKACDEAKNNGIEVYTISFGSGVPTSVKNLLRACASDSANYYHAGNGGLDDVFSMIAGQLRDSVRLTQ